MKSAPARMMKAKLVLAALMVAMTLFAAARAEAQEKRDQWIFSVTPYLWLPNVDGTLKYSIPPGADGGPEVQIGPVDYLESLQFVMMISAEARKKRWAVFTDFVYIDFGSQKSTVKAIEFGSENDPVSSSLNAGTQSSLKGGVWTLAGSYTVGEADTMTLDLLGGFRYFTVKFSSDWRLMTAVTGPGGGGQSFPASGSISERADLIDGIVGVRGQFRLGRSNWSLPYYLDFGTGSSNFTWQGMFGVAYGFSWGAVKLVYRYLYYDQSDDKLVQDMRFAGPALGVLFRF